MRHITTKKLTLQRETIRRLAAKELTAVAGGEINQTQSICADADCSPTAECTTGVNTNANGCIRTEFSCGCPH